MKMRFLPFPSLKKSALALALGALICPAFAGDGVTEAERRQLLAIIKEINNLQVLATQAAAASEKDARVQFDYQALQSDLTAMQQAIANHLEKPSRSPRRIEPLNSEYSH